MDVTQQSDGLTARLQIALDRKADGSAPSLTDAQRRELATIGAENEGGVGLAAAKAPNRHRHPDLDQQRQDEEVTAMPLTPDLVRSWAEKILAQLGAPADHILTVTGPGFAADAGTGALPAAADSAAAEEFNSSLSLALDGGHDSDGFGDEVAGLLITLAFSDGSTAGVHFEEPMAEADAVTLLADQLQDAVLEETGGAPHPPCPDHGHPAVARTVDGIASWACPAGGPSWPILPAS